MANDAGRPRTASRSLRGRKRRPRPISAPQTPSARCALRRDTLSPLAAALLLLAWDSGAGDLAVARWFGHASGFPLRSAWFTQGLLHDGGRMLSFIVLAFLIADAVRPMVRGPARAERLRWLGATLLCLLAVPAFKSLSQTSCPWDLYQFGGVARYVSHWNPVVADGGGGQCFPSGHAAAAFAFLGGYFLWRPHRPRLARAWLLGVLAAGLLFGAAQVARGAHYPSHVAWTAWLCWVICLGVDRLRTQPRARRPSRHPIKP